jgi:hypothetical protein
VAQEPVTVRIGDDTPGYARHVADAENFDVLPISEGDGRIIRYVRRTALAEHPSDTDWDGLVLDDIHPDDIVSASSPLLELLSRFSHERPRLFVLGRRRIDGIVTVYDLNQPAAHQFGFALALVVEGELAYAIEEKARTPDDELDVEVDDRILESIHELLPGKEHKSTRDKADAWQKKVKKDEQLRLTQELAFNDKLLLVDAMDIAGELAARCRSPYGNSGESLLEALRAQVKKLRNAVAHDSGALADEWSVWTWMRTTFELAEDLAKHEH